MNFLKILSVFLGTVIGVGIFGLPYVAQQAGFLVVFSYFLIMAVVVILVHFLYGDVAVHTEQKHRFPGYVGIYLGERWKKFSLLVIVVGLMGALLAYLVVGGEFLTSLLSPLWGGSVAWYTLVFFAFGAYLVFRDIKSIALVELLLVVVLLVLLAIFLADALPFLHFEYLAPVNRAWLPLPYGVVLFSLWGSALIPELKEMIAGGLPVSRRSTKNIRAQLRQIIAFGVIFTTIIYLLFVVIVLGVSGPSTSKEAISGLAQAVGSKVIKLGFVFGIIATFTSFITIALTLKKTLWYDFKFSKHWAWAIACLVPLDLFFLGLREFISIISFTGALSLGAEGVLTVFLYREFQRKKFKKNMHSAVYLLVAVFAIGLVFETMYFLIPPR